MGERKGVKREESKESNLRSLRDLKGGILGGFMLEL